MNHLRTSLPPHIRLNLALAVAVVLLVAGCAPSYQFRVNALNDPATPSAALATYTLTSPMIENPATDLQFQEAAAYVREGLASLGFVEARDPAAAQLRIEVVYGIGDGEQETVRSLEPVYGYTRGRSFSVAVPAFNSEGEVIGYVRRVYYTPGHWGHLGYADGSRTTTVFEKFLRLEAYDNRGNTPRDDQPQVWVVDVVNRDRSQDLRSYLPLMTAAALPYVGANTGKQTTVTLREDSPDVITVRQGAAGDRLTEAPVRPSTDA